MWRYPFFFPPKRLDLHLHGYMQRKNQKKCHKLQNLMQNTPILQEIATCGTKFAKTLAMHSVPKERVRPAQETCKHCLTHCYVRNVNFQSKASTDEMVESSRKKTSLSWNKQSRRCSLFLRPLLLVIVDLLPQNPSTCC